MNESREAAEHKPEVQRAYRKLLLQKMQLTIGGLFLLVLGLFLSFEVFSGAFLDPPWQFYVGGPLSVLGGVVILTMAFRSGWGITDMVSQSLLDEE